jgi:hypothetical protein
VPAELRTLVPLEELLTEAGRASHFVSLWAVGPSGLAAIPDQLLIGPARPARTMRRAPAAAGAPSSWEAVRE